MSLKLPEGSILPERRENLARSIDAILKHPRYHSIDEEINRDAKEIKAKLDDGGLQKGFNEFRSLLEEYQNSELGKRMGLASMHTAEAKMLQEFLSHLDKLISVRKILFAKKSQVAKTTDPGVKKECKRSFDKAILSLADLVHKFMGKASKQAKDS